MSELRLRLAPGVSVEPMYEDIDLDCRLLFLGDRYRQLVRAHTEAMFRLSRNRPLSDRAAYLRSSAEIAQFYEVTERDGTIALQMRDSAFFDQAPLDEIDLHLVASQNDRTLRVPLPLDRLNAVGALLPLLNGEHGDLNVVQDLDARLDSAGAQWARELLGRWSDAGFIERAPVSANEFLAAQAAPRVTFMGHTSLLMQSRRSAVLTDPLFRVRWGTPRRTFDATRLTLGAICCSHNHWDHCDLATLLNFDKATPVIVPRARTPSAFNPPMVPALNRLGFTDVRQIDTWERIQIDDIEIVAVPFHGEQDEPGAEIDHYTYVLRTDGLSLYGGVDAYRDTFGEMPPALERVRREWAPDIAFLPVSRMTYAWKHGGVNGFCRHVDTELLEQRFQYTASADQAADWARLLGVHCVVPYATSNFAPFDMPAEAKQFDDALNAIGLRDRLVALRPLDAIGMPDLSPGLQSAIRRRYLLALLGGITAAKRVDSRLTGNPAYQLAKRMLGRDGSHRAFRH